MRGSCIECGLPIWARRLCHKHYEAKRRAGTLMQYALPVRHYEYHKVKNSRLYQAWANMLDRCRNPQHRQYRFYGGRGIEVCERWFKFENFLADMGQKPSSAYSLDRIDNNGHYELVNCRWATRSEQQNNKRNNRLIRYSGKTQTETQWAKELGLWKGTIRRRLSNGWSVDEALIISSSHGNRWLGLGKKSSERGYAAPKDGARKGS